MPLRIEGDVTSPRAFEIADLDALPDRVDDVGALVPGRRGTGVRLSAVLAAAGARPSARWATLSSSDGAFAISVPLQPLLDRGVLLYRLGGEPLPRAQGGPVRMLVADADACGGGEIDACAAVKDLGAVRLTAEREPDVGHVHR
jgi:DMSO/TMAO reductase YedYZ molybdopterin-dependent catalytic subunit